MWMDDIVPELLEKIKSDFFEQAEKSAELEKLLLLARSGKANFIDAHEFATKLGQILSEALQNNISGLILPDGKMHFNIASRILNETLGTNHKMVSTYAKQVQEILNKEAGIGLKSIQAPINQERINGLVNRLSYEEKFEDVSWILKEPIVNFNQNVVDNHIKVNADFHFKSGLKPKIVRTTDGNCCAWCSKLAGIYIYPDVSKDVFRRHARCTCTVDYHPGDGKKQNVWSKKWSNVEPKEQNTKAIRTTKHYISVREEWLKNYKEAKFNDLLFWNVDGKKLKVDDKHVVLDYSEKEKEVGKWMAHTFGVHVQMVPRVNYPERVNTPDYLINDKKFDLKEITGNSKGTIDQNCRKAKKQSENIIFDITNSLLSDEEVLKQLDMIYRRGIRGINISVIKRGNLVVDVLKKES